MGYEAQESDAIARRKAAWRKRTSPSASKEAATARQRKHRLLEALKTDKPAPPDADPYELAREAIIALNLLRAGVVHNENLTMKIELVAERVRWLAIGPGD